MEARDWTQPEELLTEENVLRTPSCRALKSLWGSLKNMSWSVIWKTSAVAWDNHRALDIAYYVINDSTVIKQFYEILYF